MSVEVFQSIQYAFRQIFEWEYGGDVIAANEVSWCQSGDVCGIEELRYFRIDVWQPWFRWIIIVQSRMVQGVHDGVGTNYAQFREIPIEW